MPHSTFYKSPDSAKIVALCIFCRTWTDRASLSAAQARPLTLRRLHRDSRQFILIASTIENASDQIAEYTEPEDHPLSPHYPGQVPRS